MTAFVDTNVFVRHLTGDPPAQAKRATRYLERADELLLAENVAQAFMGMRIQCAQCHNHPFDRWTQDEYYGFVAFFDQIGKKRGDDYRETIGMSLLRNGITDLNTGDPKHLERARKDLLDMTEKTSPLVNVDDYIDLPEAKISICEAWSGDMINAQYYGPKGFDTSTLRYWSMPRHAPVNNDLMVLLSSGKNPVLAHLFLNYLLEKGTQDRFLANTLIFVARKDVAVPPQWGSNYPTSNDDYYKKFQIITMDGWTQIGNNYTAMDDRMKQVVSKTTSAG